MRRDQAFARGSGFEERRGGGRECTRQWARQWKMQPMRQWHACTWVVSGGTDREFCAPNLRSSRSQYSRAPPTSTQRLHGKVAPEARARRGRSSAPTALCPAIVSTTSPLGYDSHGRGLHAGTRPLRAGLASLNSGVGQGPSCKRHPAWGMTQTAQVYAKGPGPCARAWLRRTAGWEERVHTSMGTVMRDAANVALACMHMCRFQWYGSRVL